MRQWGTDRDGPWALVYRTTSRPGLMLAVSARDWLVSGALLGWAGGVGWRRRHGRTFTRTGVWSTDRREARRLRPRPDVHVSQGPS